MDPQSSPLALDRPVRPPTPDHLKISGRTSSTRDRGSADSRQDFFVGMVDALKH